MNLIAALTLALFASAPIPPPDDKAKALDSLQGEWKAVEFTKQGKQEPKERLEKAKLLLRVKGERATFVTPDGEETSLITLDPKASPAAIDFWEVDKKAKEPIIKGIYKLGKDTLSIC